MSHWQAVLDWMGEIGDGVRYLEVGPRGQASPTPSAAEIFRRRPSLAVPHLQAFSGSLTEGISAVLHFSQFDPMWLSLARQDVQSQRHLDTLVAVLLDLGRYVGRDLLLTHEWGGPERGVLLSYRRKVDAVVVESSSMNPG